MAKRTKPHVGQHVVAVSMGKAATFHEAVIESVGRKYASVLICGRSRPFRMGLDDWRSHDTTGNDHANGFGYEVYESRHQAIQERFERHEAERLRSRAQRIFAYVRPRAIESSLVVRLHAIFDEIEQAKESSDGE